MVRGKISLGRPWWSRVFPGWAGPEEVDDVAIATIPIGGAGRYEDLQFKAHSAPNSLVVAGTPVPDGFNWWIPWCEGFHDDPALAARMWLSVRDRPANSVSITDTLSVGDGAHFGIRRPVVLASGWRIQANLDTTTAPGTDIWLKYFYVQVPIGEYVAPL